MAHADRPPASRARTRSTRSARTRSAGSLPRYGEEKASARLAVRVDRSGRARQGRAAPAGRGHRRGRRTAICWNTADGQAYRARGVAAGPRRRSHALASTCPASQPNMTVDEWHECDEMLRRHPALSARWPARGITDISLVLTDVWAYGAALVPRALRRAAGSAGRTSGTRQPGRQPVRSSHHRPASGRRPEPDGTARAGGRLRPRAADGLPRGDGRVPARADPGRRCARSAPLQVSQPEGVSFTLDGRLLRWQNWELRLGFNYREGLVLHTVGLPRRRAAAARSRTGCRSPR